MKKKRILIISITILIIITIIISIFLFFLFKSNKQEDKLKEKSVEQINYLEEQIVSCMNTLNNITFKMGKLKKDIETMTKSNSSSDQSSSQGSSDNSTNNSSTESSTSENSKNEKQQTKYDIQNNNILLLDLSNIDWNYIKDEIDNLHSIWPSIIVDLYTLNVNNQDILNFSTALDQTTIDIKQENKKAVLNDFANLYSYLPKYFEQTSKDNKKINLAYTKSYILNSYALVEQNNWDGMKTQISEANNYFSKIMNSVDENTEYIQNRITKTYILLNELNNAINKKDKELYYIKYKNVIEELIDL